MVIDINHLYSSLILRGVVVGAGFSTSVDHEQVAMIAVELQDEITKLLAALGQQGQHTIGTPFEISIAAKFHHVPPLDGSKRRTGNEPDYPLSCSAQNITGSTSSLAGHRKQE